jgi:hypothetical protein
MGLTQTPCLRLVMRRSAVGDDRRLRTKVSNTASADTCTHMDSPGRSYAGARLRPGGRASRTRQRSGRGRGLCRRLVLRHSRCPSVLIFDCVCRLLKLLECS